MENNYPNLQTPILLITPPFTQLNTPYPGTVYLKGFLKTKDMDSRQADLGIEVILKLFSKAGLIDLFQTISQGSYKLGENAQRILALQSHYIACIDPIIQFLQGKNPTLANAIVQEDYLPQASRFLEVDDLSWAFGSMGFQDKAKHLATLFLEDISDLIIETVDPDFGFSRYAERMARSANSFDALHNKLNASPSYIDKITLESLEQLIVKYNPNLIGFSAPFPGNIYSAFKCAQYIKSRHPHIKTCLGGGFANTELRSVSDTRVFEYFDFITLDDGERPIEQLIRYTQNQCEVSELKRTFLKIGNTIEYINNPTLPDYKQSQVGTPDYSDLDLSSYLSVIEVVNPMHRLWSDGRWNKLTMAHGCYWGKCTFCDISLDYIKIYEPVAASLIVDRMEDLIAQTGNNGFHFVDEAAPPALMREVALEILRRNLVVTWWTNIRFEKSFTLDLCRLLKASGCIAVSGGLEVASDRLLALIEKGVTVEQVAKVNQNFTQSGIMVHAYLMYGFPTQTAQETIDSLEMVRQMFELGILQSGFWHQFAMTAHAPVGMNPEKYQVVNLTPELGTFANNDLVHQEKSGMKHDKFSFGLKKSLFNYMHGLCLDYDLQEWFDFKVPRTKVAPHYIQSILEQEALPSFKPTQKIAWIGTTPTITYFTKTKKGRNLEKAQLTFHTKSAMDEIEVDKTLGDWLVKVLHLMHNNPKEITRLDQLKQHYQNFDMEDDFELFLYSKTFKSLQEIGLLLL